ncbi:unnamed protein product [Cercopithifilaria johnstoni]|uniref:Uncharacterized protein n=1 Tax=Cercopithifilaria johnstoni TaxID=2874296 RepID=A0A8J2PW01_9BILA|nr:unnamed protein product [Cercopithifilaria johnstoni]
MAQLCSGYTVPGSIAQQLIVQCPNCTLRFSLSPTFIYPQWWLGNVTYSQTSNVQYIQPFIQYPNPQSDLRSAFYTPTPSSSHIFDINQQHQEMTDSSNSRQHVSQDAADMNDTIFRHIRDILIDILSSATRKYGITIYQLMVLLKQSCANYNVILPPSITDDFKEFLRNKMSDYVEVEDDLCRYRRPTLSIQEESISNSSVCERRSNFSETSAALVPLQEYYIASAIDTNASYSADQVKKVISKKKEIKESITYKSSEQFFDGIEERHRNDDADKTAVTDPVVPDRDKKCNILHKHVENDTISTHSYTKNDLAKIMGKWKEIFIGDLKELIRYLRMVDDYFHESDGRFTLAKFKEVFGELSKRWEFCDIDLVEMDIISIVHDIDLNKELVLRVNPIIREMEFPEVAELAKEIYNLLSKLLQSMNSVKVEIIVRTVNFGINDSKTISEKYTLLWEVLSDSHFQDVFIVDILQKQNKERGFDVMVRLNA